MAEVDNRVKTLEDELKVIKGEVKRTLVDLRAMLMREDSPLNEGGFSRRTHLGDYNEGGPGAVNKAEAATGSVNDAAKNEANTPPGARQVADPTQQLPGLGPGGMFPPGYPGVQDKMMMGNNVPGLGPYGVLPNGAPNPNLPPWAAPGAVGQNPAEGQRNGTTELIDDREETTTYRNGARVRSRREEREAEESEHRRRDRNGRSRDQQESRRSANTEDDQREGRRNGKGSRLYDEYQELLDESEAAYQNPASLRPDVNLVANLLRWASMARRRVGEARLKALIDLYLQVNQAAASQRELLLQAVNLAEAAPEATGDTQDIIDLLFHLHGILAGGFSQPMTTAPRRD